MAWVLPKRVPHRQSPPFYGILFLAFVALVLPFDSFEGLQGQTLRPFFYGLEAVTDLGRPKRDALCKRQERSKRGKAILNIEVV